MARPKEYQEEKVLDAVMNVFWERGFEATSAQNLVDATGLTRSSLYDAFVSKQGLFEQALIRYTLRTRQHVAMLDNAADKKQAIYSLLLDIVDTDLSRAVKRGCLVTNTAIESGDKDERIIQLVRQNLQLLSAGLERNITLAQQSGEIASLTDANILAACLLNTIQGLRVLAKTTPPENRKTLIDIIDTTLSSLF